jgi:hypothetical protein
MVGVGAGVGAGDLGEGEVAGTVGRLDERTRVEGAFDC